MAMVASNPEDVGKLLVKVQEDLHQLKEKLLAQGDGVDVSTVEQAFLRTQQDIQKKTDLVMNQLNNQVATLPSLEMQQQQAMMPTYHQMANAGQHGLGVTWDIRTINRGGGALGRPHGIPINAAMLTGPIRLPKNTPIQMQGLTPGQVSKHTYNQQVMSNPYNQKTRQILNDNYGVQLPPVQQKKVLKPIQKLVTGSTVEQLQVLPKANRVDAGISPPAISEDDAKRGILSLMERGLIPPAADVTLEPSAVRQKSVKLHEERDASRGKPPPAICDAVGNLAGVKLDTSMNKMPVVAPRINIPFRDRPDSMAGRLSSLKSRTGSSTTVSRQATSFTNFDMSLGAMPPPTTPAVSDIAPGGIHHKFVIQDGKLKDTTKDFLACKQHYCLTWGSIVTMIQLLEKLCKSYAIPVAFINGDRLADLSLEFELEEQPSMDDLLSVILNSEDVRAMISKPGRRFQGTNGKDLAAARIQATWRFHVDYQNYHMHKKQKWAAGVIAVTWIMTVKLAKMRKMLRQCRADMLEMFRRRNKKFAASWARIKTSRRVVVHVPSLGLSQKIRDNISEFGVRQNTQMARLCDLRDPNVDVIFISPVPMSDETIQYYNKLLGLRGAIESGVVDNQADISERFRIIVPDAIKSFPSHRMCLSSILKYSPRAIKRIKNLIRGRDAYMMTGVPHSDDIYLSDKLDIPVFCTEPEIASLYSTKSGSKRIFSSANVAIPPGEYDIYSLPQLHEAFATLVTDNLLVTRWLFKLDDEFEGRGIAFCDVTKHLRCYEWAMKECIRYGDKWKKKWAQEAVFTKIQAEIPDILTNHALTVNKRLYPTWEKFLKDFLSQGGIIEACPPSDSITTLSVDMLIEPDGVISMVCSGDQIHADSPYKAWGASMPQASIDPDIINKASWSVAEACKKRGVLGHFCIDFVTFIDCKTMEQALWATDLDLSYSDNLAMFQLMSFLTKGTFDSKTHSFDVPLASLEHRKQRRRLEDEEEEPAPNPSRYAAMSTQLLHTNLAVVHYSVFFQMCRAHGIGYDIKEKQGTVFTLIDSFNREKLGMISIGDDLQATLASFARNLNVIHQEISAPNMQGETNFKDVVCDIEVILGTTVENALEAAPGTNKEHTNQLTV